MKDEGRRRGNRTLVLSLIDYFGAKLLVMTKRNVIARFPSLSLRGRLGDRGNLGGGAFLGISSSGL